MPIPAAEIVLPQPGRPCRRSPDLAFLDGLRLARARVHEFCGPARRTLALMAARETAGPVIWIQAGWLPERLFPDGIGGHLCPARLIQVTARRAEDMLWSMEEALRAGAAALVVADLPAPPGLTPVRRLHLAAETGAAEGRVAPVGLALTPGDGGAAGVESRWRLDPRHGPAHSRWLLERRRARTDPPASWRLDQGRDGALVLRRADGPGAVTSGA